MLPQQARDWWTSERPQYVLATSQLVLDEASLGDPSAAAERLRLLADLPLIPTDRRVEAVADELVARSLVPEKARLDALHVALAAERNPVSGKKSLFPTPGMVRENLA